MVKMTSVVMTRGLRSSRLFRERLMCDLPRVGSLPISITCLSYDAFRPRKVVVLTKTTRYEFEKARLFPDQNMESCSDELKKSLLARGSNYYELKKRHNRHHEILDHVLRRLRDEQIEVKVVSKQEYTEGVVAGADAVFSAGGDGTYLLAASKIHDRSMPLVGINTDPERSEGYLCLPRKFSLNFSTALERLLSGKFRWLWRSRIRITLSERHANDDPVELNNQRLKHPEDRFTEHVKEEHEVMTSSPLSLSMSDHRPSRVLPVLALNDIFIGESLSARVSFYEMCVDDTPSVKQKSSGLAVSTGTGSSSWHFNINYMQKQDVREVLKLANGVSGSRFDFDDKNLLDRIADCYNSSLRYDPMALKMAYTIRDPVNSGIFQVSNPRGFANRISVRSRMWDASIVIDGGVSFQFNDGARALLEIHEEDSLRSILLPE